MLTTITLGAVAAFLLVAGLWGPAPLRGAAWVVLALVVVGFLVSLRTGGL